MAKIESGSLAVPKELSQPLLERLRKAGYVKPSWTIEEKVHEGMESWDALLGALQKGGVRDCDRELIFDQWDNNQGGINASR